LPAFTTCAGPRTEPAGFVGITWPVTSQSNRWRSAARPQLRGRCCVFARLLLDPGRDMQWLHGDDRRYPVVLAPGHELRHGWTPVEPGERGDPLSPPTGAGRPDDVGLGINLPSDEPPNAD
jgi:hypothetical protein